jgi:hypothetical protein
MEQTNTPSNLFELHIDNESTAYLGETAKWTKFLSILGFVFCGLLIIVGIFFGSIIGTLFSGGFRGVDPAGTAAARSFGGIFAVIYIVIALLYFFPCLYLYNFSTKMQVALRSNDQEQLATSFKNLKSCFKFLGIFTLVILGIYLLAFIIGIIGAIAR